MIIDPLVPAHKEVLRPGFPVCVHRLAGRLLSVSRCSALRKSEPTFSQCILTGVFNPRKSAMSRLTLEALGASRVTTLMALLGVLTERA